MGPNKRSHGIQFRAETVQLFKNLHCIIKPKLNNAKPLVILLNKPKINAYTEAPPKTDSSCISFNTLS
jgi:hypothetical protein